MRVPGATYRVQLNSRFQFRDALAIVPYLHDLGITDLYTSPIATARSGSDHGYDIVDPTSLNPELGSEEDFLALSEAVREQGMGLLLDIVPNHVAAVPENPWWADVLTHGADSSFAHYFDIDWEGGDGKLVLPILERPLSESLRDGEIDVEAGGEGPALRCGRQRLPLSTQSRQAAGGGRPDMERLLELQAYRLVPWRDTGAINYRRFFDVNELAGVRVEEADVFEAMHELTFRLVAKGHVTGLRIDHIDGLHDPTAYLAHLRSRLADLGPNGRSCFVVVEKILSASETLPPTWPVAGTTGYDFLNDVNGLFIQPEGLAALQVGYAEAVGSSGTLVDVAFEQKRRMARELFPAELRRLVDACKELAGGAATRDELESAIVDVSAALPVYRTYVRDTEVTDSDRDRIEAAIVEARLRNPPLSQNACDVLRQVLLLEPPHRHEAARRFVLDWQQFTGPLTAKGFEDTALYQYCALLSGNEVGANPNGPVVDVETFHRRNQQRASRWPHSLNATATHDTKRGEDARARLNVLSERTSEWLAHAQQGTDAGADVAQAPSANDRWLLQQSLLAVRPAAGEEHASVAERLRNYAIKAAREAKSDTSWLAPDGAYERSLTKFVHELVDGRGSSLPLAGLQDLLGAVAFFGAINSLAQLVLKIASPGVPDFYQGTESWDLSLVDPDNRQSVNFDNMRRSLADLRTAPPSVRELLHDWTDGRLKAYVMLRGLHLRRALPDLFEEGDYAPLRTRGDRADHVLAFAREHAGHWVLVAAPRLVAEICRPGEWPIGRAVWGDTEIVLPEHSPSTWRNALTDHGTLGTEGSARRVLHLADALSELPVALLTPADDAEPSPV